MKITLQFSPQSDNWIKTIGGYFIGADFGVYGIARYGNREILKLGLLSTLFLGLTLAFMTYMAILPPSLYFFVGCYLLVSITSIIELNYDKDKV